MEQTKHLLQALIGAIFLDSDFESSYRFVEKNLFEGKLDMIIRDKLYLSSKNRLQEFWQEKYKLLPEYRLIKEWGPEHSKHYSIGVYHKDRLLGTGEGGSKKTAEEQAARFALQKLGL